MRIRLSVSKHGKGDHEFFGAFKRLLKAAKTWQVEAANPMGVTIVSTATLSSLPCQPRWRFTKDYAGVAVVECLNAELEPAQKAHALGDLVYLCLTSLGSFVAKIEIAPLPDPCLLL